MAEPITSSLPHLNLDDISLEERIGQGNAPVYKATMAGKVMAAKKMNCDKNQIPYEVEVHSSLLPHPYILPLLGVSHTKDGFTVYICMELADKSLYKYLHEEKSKPSLQQSTKWAVQIARAMQHVHQRGKAHRDLKSANVLLFEKEGIAKVCDFGSACLLEKTATTTNVTGTYRWMAPEYTDKGVVKVNQRCDVFSYAMILFELFAHEVPFSHIKEGFEVLPLIRNGERPTIPPELPAHVKKLMQSCWKHDSHDRPTFTEILQALDLGPQLLKAAASGDSSAVQQLIEDGVDVDSQHKDGWTALIAATLNRHVSIVQLLLDAYADVSICEKNGFSPLCAASGVGNTETVDMLLRNGADPNQVATSGADPLGIAAHSGHTRTVERLLKGGAIINYQDKDGATPLIIASQIGHKEVVEILLKNTAIPNLTAKNGASPLYMASQKGHADLVDILLKHGADPNLALTTHPYSAPLEVAAFKGHTQVVKRLLERGSNINHQDRTGRTPMDIAQDEGHPQVVDLLKQFSHTH